MRCLHSTACLEKEMIDLKEKNHFQKRNAGFTLIETLVTTLILVIIVIGMDSGLNSAVRIYDESVFYSDSHTLASIMDATLGDVLQYSERIHEAEDVYDLMGQPVEYVFTNAEYGMKDAYIDCYSGADKTPHLELKSAQNQAKFYGLINSGAFPNMTISSFSYHYDPDDAAYSVQYVITATNNAALSYDSGVIKYYVMNPD